MNDNFSDILKNMAGALIVGVISVIGTVSAIDVKIVSLKEDVMEIKSNQEKITAETKRENRDMKKRIRSLELLHARDMTTAEINRLLTGEH